MKLEEGILNWRLEEKIYLEKEVDEYLKNISTLSRICMSNKTLNKNINYIKEQARLSYRGKKLDTYLEEIKKERERISKLVNDLNNKFNDFLEEQKHIISKNIKPFQCEVKPYDNLHEPTLNQLEVVTIHCEPLKLSFIQEHIDESKGE